MEAKNTEPNANEPHETVAVPLEKSLMVIYLMIAIKMISSMWRNVCGQKFIAKKTEMTSSPEYKVGDSDDADKPDEKKLYI